MTPAHLEALRARNTVLLDLDGVVWAGSVAFPGAVEAIARLRRLGKCVAFLSNNSATRPEGVQQKLIRLGIPATPAEVATSGIIAAELLSQRPDARARGAYIAGSDDLLAMCSEHGVAFAAPETAAAVLLGLDKKFDYQKLQNALTALENGAFFMVCNRDASFPGEGDKLVPGCGALAAAVETASGRKVDLAIGKPNRLLFDRLVKHLGVSPESCLVVGDSLDSDIGLARAVGVPGFWIRSDAEAATQDRLHANESQHSIPGATSLAALALLLDG